MLDVLIIFHSTYYLKVIQWNHTFDLGAVLYNREFVLFQRRFSIECVHKRVLQLVLYWEVCPLSERPSVGGSTGLCVYLYHFKLTD